MPKLLQLSPVRAAYSIPSAYEAQRAGDLGPVVVAQCHEVPRPQLDIQRIRRLGLALGLPQQLP